MTALLAGLSFCGVQPWHVLGPIAGNRLADAHKTPPAPRLRQRLAQVSCRGTPLGSVATGPDGRLSFAPSHTMPNGCDTATATPPGASISTFLPGRRGRVTATLLEELVRQDPGPLAALAAQAVAGRKGVVVEGIKRLLDTFSGQ